MQTVIIGAGPAGLTAAYELCEHGQQATILEADPVRVGGLSQTAAYRGYRFDIGGHRFFSKNQEITALWSKILGDEMIDVPRMSRIIYRGKLYDYPLKAVNALSNLGVFEAIRCLASYFYARVFPKNPVISVEDWVSNQFGQRLYRHFFKTYTEKVWGMPCTEITADWAAQRIKGLSLWKAALNAIGVKDKGDTVKTLIEKFRYPRLGPGMMWERLAEQVTSKGCEVHMGSPVTRLDWNSAGVTEVVADGRSYPCASVISSMPIRQLVEALAPSAPPEVLSAARALKYRDFLTVVLIVRDQNLFPDNWIYIHDPDVKVGRIQNYKNWSKDMVADQANTALGLEYFCFEGDGLWTSADADLIELATAEVGKLGLCPRANVLDGTVVRMPKAYPVYDQAYQANVEIVRAFLARELPNLQLVGRNGMHRYNNQDHAMLTGMLAARNLLKLGHYDLWRVNGDAEYLEEDRIPFLEDARLVPRKI